KRHSADLPETSRKVPRIRTQSRVADTTKSENSCDEVACLIDPSALCCEPDTEAMPVLDREEELALRPYKVSRNQAKQAFAGIQSAVNRCYDRNDFGGIATLTLTISSEGQVQSSRLSDGSDSFQSCIQSAASTLTFPKLQQPFTLSYPVRQN
ncbi:MAG: hypothetical protein JKY56_05445, partial [Kofleriaceae bacterium]|nr:hypothetical protein [Kofleriaceae bacterium]